MKEPTIVPLSGKSNVAIVVDQLEKLIADGFWKPEEKILSEAELCSKFNVGRSTIREALNMLKAKNLVYTVPGLGTFVAKAEKLDSVMVNAHIPDPKSERDLLNIMELRLSIEPLNAAFAARRATDEQIAELCALKNQLVKTPEKMRFAQSDLAFHLLIAEATGNPMVVDVMNTVAGFLQEQQIITSQQKGRRSRASVYHEQVYDAIKARDDHRAEDVMREHMDDTYIYVKSMVNLSERRSGRWLRRNERN